MTQSIQSLSKITLRLVPNESFRRIADRVVYDGKQYREHKSAKSDRVGSLCQSAVEPRYRDNRAIVLCGQPATRCNYVAVIVARLTYAIVRPDRNIEELSDVLALMIDRVDTFGRRISDMRATAKVQH